ncbi:acyl carrier protein [Alicyclobacillus sp.]|uniref:acyl carrier protein n=1 Tax=Alicyclobacillus sp. TaxID=61169 RepID=UPI0025C542A1|nr:acyl carrier protein [Alicyclobacillus sp.]MCL6516854.1 acyl carrier protein [Alicyclobacillus sp.]
MLNRVYNIVARQLPDHADKLSPDARFSEDLGADSLDITELVVSFEDEFSIEIPDEALADIRTVGDAARFIQRAVRG